MAANSAKKDQFVVAYIADFDHADVVLSHAVQLSSMLHKGLILLYIEDTKYPCPSTAEAETRLQAIKPPDAVYCAMKGDTREIIGVLPTLLNAVVAVAGVDASAPRRSPLNPKTVLRNFAECKIAFLTAQKPADGQVYAKRVGITVDFKKESKEKLLWGSYFVRFNQSSLYALYVDYKDDGHKQKWYSNMKFLLKFMNSLSLQFQPCVIGTNANNLDLQAVDYAHANAIDLLCCVTTKDKDLLDQLIGPQEERTIANRWQIPILFLNPREDLYVLCD